MRDGTDVRERMIQLAKQLLDRTLEGKLSWIQTDDEREFLYSGTNTSASIADTVRGSRDRKMLNILNSRGVVVESLTDDHDVSVSQVLEELYIAARRNALDVDSVLEGLFADLEGESAVTDTSEDEK